MLPRIRRGKLPVRLPARKTQEEQDSENKRRKMDMMDRSQWFANSKGENASTPDLRQRGVRNVLVQHTTKCYWQRWVAVAWTNVRLS